MQATSNTVGQYMKRVLGENQLWSSGSLMLESKEHELCTEQRNLLTYIGAPKSIKPSWCWLNKTLTYCQGFWRQYSSKVLAPLVNAFSILSKLKMLHIAASSPVCIIKSNGDSISLSENFKDTTLTSSAASSFLTKLEWRTRTGKTRPGVKKSWAGRRGLSRIVTAPVAPTPFGWVRDLRAKPVWNFLTYRASCDALNGPGSGGGCERMETV